MVTPALPAANSPHEKSDPVEINIWGVKLKVPVPRPVLYTCAGALLLGAVLLFLSKYFVVLEKQTWSNASNAASAYAQLLPNTELAEFQKHWEEQPKWTFPRPTSDPSSATALPAEVSLKYFASDGCILVTRDSPGRPRAQHWILDLSHVQISSPPSAEKKVSLPIMSDLPRALLANLDVGAIPDFNIQKRREVSRFSRADDRDPASFLGVDDHELHLRPVQMLGGHCINPHPGQFNQWYGAVNGCFVQVWRQWPDGCTHFQWFNRCYNYFDPNITWTNCVH